MKRKQILRWFGNKCFICGYKFFIDIHHLKHKSDGGTDEIENCVVLCSNCHKEWHYVENTYYKISNKISKDRLEKGRDHIANDMRCYNDVIDYFEKGKLPYINRRS